MNKAFIFDMDGVIINSERIWKKYQRQFLTGLMGKAVYDKVKPTILGSTTNMIYDFAQQHGFTMEKKKFLQRYDQQAVKVYAESALTTDIDILLQTLTSLHFKVGLVSASRTLWIELVLAKLKNRNIFEYVISLAEREDLKPKPYPDGYVETIKKLNSTPEKTIILEDSIKGIAAAKASGAFTICLQEHLPVKDVSKDADMYVKDIKTLLTFLEEVKL